MAREVCMGILRSLALLIGAATTLLLMATSLHATTITSGQTGVSPTDFGTVPTTTPLDEVSGSFSIGGGAITGSYEEGVVVDPFGVTCAGCLDFFVVVSEDSTSTGSITRIGLDGRFPEFSDNVGYAILPGGGVAPTSAAFGTPVPNAPISELLTLSPGETSDVMVIATNATSYGPDGNLGFSDSAGDSIPVIPGMLTPVATPEPGIIYLLGTGLLGLIGCTYRRKPIA